MTITQVISKLQSLQAEHGDVVVRAFPGLNSKFNPDYANHITPDGISYYRSDNCVDIIGDAEEDANQ